LHLECTQRRPLQSWRIRWPLPQSHRRHPTDLTTGNRTETLLNRCILKLEPSNTDGIIKTPSSVANKPTSKFNHLYLKAIDTSELPRAVDLGTAAQIKIGLWHWN
jgi:hypothetical protein